MPQEVSLDMRCQAFVVFLLAAGCIGPPSAQDAGEGGSPASVTPTVPPEAAKVPADLLKIHGTATKDGAYLRSIVRLNGSNVTEEHYQAGEVASDQTWSIHPATAAWWSGLAGALPVGPDEAAAAFPAGASMLLVRDEPQRWEAWWPSPDGLQQAAIDAMTGAPIAPFDARLTLDEALGLVDVEGRLLAATAVPLKEFVATVEGIHANVSLVVPSPALPGPINGSSHAWLLESAESPADEITWTVVTREGPRAQGVASARARLDQVVWAEAAAMPTVTAAEALGHYGTTARNAVPTWWLSIEDHGGQRWTWSIEERSWDTYLLLHIDASTGERHDH